MAIKPDIHPRHAIASHLLNGTRHEFIATFNKYSATGDYPATALLLNIKTPAMGVPIDHTWATGDALQEASLRTGEIITFTAIIKERVRPSTSLDGPPLLDIKFDSIADVVIVKKDKSRYKRRRR